MCGEHQSPRRSRVSRKGSSPHVRGTLAKSHGNAPFLRIIPACAGNTRIDAAHHAVTGDHPRMCGEHVFFVLRDVHDVGSSPHVRGTLCDRTGQSQIEGIIPACAGNTCRRRLVYRDQWDHPRMCGEHCRDSNTNISSQGSSPHVRGTLYQGQCIQIVERIIPACAGNTFMREFFDNVIWDHPRMCGEHVFISTAIV